MTRIYVAVTGDLFHYGHLSFFKKARKFGDYLLVGVHSDEDVAIFKWPPVLNLNERVSVIESCKLVNEPNIPYMYILYFAVLLVQVSTATLIIRHRNLLVLSTVFGRRTAAVTQDQQAITG